MGSGSIATLLFKSDGIKITELQHQAREMTSSVLLAVTLAYSSVFVRSQAAVFRPPATSHRLLRLSRLRSMTNQYWWPSLNSIVMPTATLSCRGEASLYPESLIIADKN